jgi:hypothetical protein
MAPSQFALALQSRSAAAFAADSSIAFSVLGDLRLDRDLHRERILGAILPLHDFRYRAPAVAGGFETRPYNCGRGKRFPANERAVLADCPLVEPDGIEPTTSCLQSRRSPN